MVVIFSEFLTVLLSNVANNQSEHCALAPPPLGGESWAGRVVSLPRRLGVFLPAGPGLPQPGPGGAPGRVLLRHRGGNSEDRHQQLQVSPARALVWSHLFNAIGRLNLILS